MYDALAECGDAAEYKLILRASNCFHKNFLTPGLFMNAQISQEAIDDNKMGVVMATFLVAGNMMGSGVFMLPANLAAFGSITLISWLITTFGAIALALTFSRLASIDPAAGGPYAYARKAFGDYMGYQTNLVYWVANVVGNVSITVAGIGYLSHFITALKIPHVAVAAQIFVIWLLAYLNMLGPRCIGMLQSFATTIKLVPILGVALLGWVWFQPDLFAASWNVSGQGDFSAIQSTINLTLWAFIGVESASVSTAVVRDPRKNVPIATICGVSLAGVCYILSSSVIMGLIPNDQLAASSAPFADAVALALGPAAAHVVAFCAAVGCLGSLGGWILLVSQSAKAASTDGLFGEIFSRVNKKGVPVSGLIVVAALMSVFVLVSAAPKASRQFEILASTSVILTLMPYLYSCVAIKALGFNKLSNNQYFIYVAIGFVGALFCLLSLVSSNPSQTRWSLIFVIASIVFYSAAITRRREMDEGLLRAGGIAPGWVRWLTLAVTIALLILTFIFTVDDGKGLF